MSRRWFSPTPMKKVEILALDRDIERLTWALGELGVVHLTAAPYRPETAGLQGHERADELALCREVEAVAHRLIEELSVDPSAQPEAVPYVPMKDIRSELATLEHDVQELLEHRDAAEARIAELKQMLGEVEPFRRVGVPLKQLKDLSFVHFATGQIAEREVPGLTGEIGSSALLIPLQDRPAEGGRRIVVAVSSRKGRFALESALEKHHFTPKDLSEEFDGIPGEVCGRLKGDLDGEVLELSKTNMLRIGLGQRHGGRLLGWLARAQSEIEVIHAQAHFSRTHNTFLINGWVPEDRIAPLQQVALKETGGNAVIEVSDPDADAPDDVPTQIRRAPWLQPFALLVSAYGFPGYREIEPTLVVAISFLIMFGLMFGDVGHGALLAVGGLVVWRKAAERSVRDVAQIIAFAGGASMLFGLVYGSVFGYEVKHLGLIRPMEGMMPFIGATVAFGSVVICVGLLINIINRLRSGDYYNGVLGRTGIVGAIFYTGALGLGVRAVVSGGGVATWQVIALIALPLLVIFLREPIYALITRRNKLFHEGAFGGLMEAGVEVMETVSSYISNTASFARVGAFALSHAGLCLAIFEMVKIVGRMPAAPLLTVLVLVAGTALIVTLEAMVVGIQVMRLEYYEFFSKFFTGRGKAYRPFHIRGWAAKERP